MPYMQALLLYGDAAGFEPGPSESRIVKARWPAALVPPPGTHAFWLAAVLARSGHPAADRHVWEHNNLAQKNSTVVERPDVADIIRA